MHVSNVKSSSDWFMLTLPSLHLSTANFFLFPFKMRLIAEWDWSCKNDMQLKRNLIILKHTSTVGINILDIFQKFPMNWKVLCRILLLGNFTETPKSFNVILWRKPKTSKHWNFNSSSLIETKENLCWAMYQWICIRMGNISLNMYYD